MDNRAKSSLIGYAADPQAVREMTTLESAVNELSRLNERIHNARAQVYGFNERVGVTVPNPPSEAAGATPSGLLPVLLELIDSGHMAVSALELQVDQLRKVA